MTTEPLELVPDSLYRLGGVVPIDGRLSWRPQHVRGYEPIGAYLLRTGDKALLVGTGVRLHRGLILDQLRQLVGERELQVYVDRNEADEIGNLAPVVHDFAVRQIWFAGAGHLLRWFEHDDFAGIVPSEPVINFLIPAASPDRKLIRESDRPDTVAFDPARPLELLYTRLTVLGFAWLFDPSTGTLFSSDFFSAGRLTARDEPAVARDDLLDADSVRDHLDARFYWMRAADTTPLVANLDEIFAGRDVQRIAPYHGTVIEGRERVARHLQLTRDVLAGYRATAHHAAAQPDIHQPVTTG